ncbi:hypothetical protein [Nodularia sp. LEGE 04288]|uniref:hypothetical protein n=1 Tax=Nodularia sp. LEGE 04288 TaxID=1828639 RepID=UPI001D11CC6C|nr:hypothetical protein [Nodularia sp. LEGE 04288]MCC2695800.1 hypothetical protein [Nodularia sp. LEGE 04288]
MSHPILILLLTMLAGSLYLAWLVINSRKSARRRYRRTTRKSPEKLKRVNSSTRSKLLRMVRGDEELAYRLVRQVKASAPNQSDQWCWEKAIWDLERDRN